RTIEDLTTFPGGASAERQIKTLVYVATDGATQEQYAVLALLRGDHPLHETKLADSLGASAVRPAHPEEIRELLGASAGSLGGVGAREKVKQSGFATRALTRAASGTVAATAHWSGAVRGDLKIIADNALTGRHNMTTGANKDDHHLRGVDIERDIRPDSWADLRTVASGERCPNCESGALEVFKALEVGHIFKLGTKYSVSM